MCGIAGWLAIGKNPFPREEILATMASRIAHRGPDAQGVETSGPIGLAHRRLSVIDLHSAANQPMQDSEKNLLLVFNGEIYNFTTLRSELESLGHYFRTRSDTEVILASYKQWGTDCLSRLQGMFAFALWDSQKQELFLARDRLGKKPLYISHLPDGDFLFASEVKALQAHPSLPGKIDSRAVIDVLETGYILGPKSILSAVSQLEPAHAMTISREGRIRNWRYWDLAAFFHNKSGPRDFDEAAEALRSLIDQAVRDRMVSDVPLGAFLSGGIDSSTIVASMARLSASPDQIKSFSTGFEEAGYSELPEARSTAALLGVDHKDEVVTADHTRNFGDMIRFMDAPFADSSFIPMFYLSEMTRKHVTVALSGDGADELFAGYPTYMADRMHRVLKRIPGPLVRMALSGYRSLVPASHGKVSFDYKLRQFLAAHSLSEQRAHYSWRQLFTRQEWTSLLDPEHVAAAGDYDPWTRFASFYEEVQGLDPLDQALYVDIKTWLADDILVKVDRTSMAHSLEARAPFLDTRIVEFAAGLPPSFKMKGREKKRILRASQTPLLPSAIFKRRKRGFNAPVAHWTEQLARILPDSHRQDSQLLNGSAVGKLLDDHRNRRRDNGFRLLALGSLESWCQAQTSRS